MSEKYLIPLPRTVESLTSKMVVPSDSTFSISLDGRDYILRLMYNSFGAFFTLHVGDIGLGVLFKGRDLLKPVHYLRLDGLVPGGSLVLEGKEEKPTLYNLGDTMNIYYYTEG